jgi:hypothetical protein
MSSSEYSVGTAGMFDFFKTISEQRCAPPGTKLGVSLEIDGSKAIRRAADSADPSDWEELKVMLSGGHRNRVTQPVPSLPFNFRPQQCTVVFFTIDE